MTAAEQDIRFLFNFSASPVGGGLKRLAAYARWFHQHGGASFIVHPQAMFLAEAYPSNTYFPVRQSRAQRVFRECAYLGDIARRTGTPDCYYSYGIPIPVRCGRLNWFHLSNVLPLEPPPDSPTLLMRVRLRYLGRQIRRRLANADIISAESRNSLGMMGLAPGSRAVVSVNGSDDEVDAVQAASRREKENIATVVGTYWYKALDDSRRVFEMLKADHPGLRLVVVGDASPAARVHGMAVPQSLRMREDISVVGALPRTAVVDYLARSRFYISTTRVENSYNAAAEGVFLADESYVSAIGPHLELLDTMTSKVVKVPGVAVPLLHVRRQDLHVGGLKTWDTVIAEMVEHVRAARPGGLGAS
jgi:glycosyltransferase involved in cell wall biosynthesis